MQAIALKSVQIPAISLKTVAIWARRARTRAALAKLDATALQDVGISYRAAKSEANKPFWL